MVIIGRAASQRLSPVVLRRRQWEPPSDRGKNAERRRE